MKKVCVITGTRAEYGLLRSVIKQIEQSKLIDLQLVVTGTHLSPEFGMTLWEIEQDGFSPDKKIEILLGSDTPSAITKSVGVGLLGFADAFQELKPDIVLILGDRFEIFAAATAAMIARIPIGHIHGGEATQGLIDEAIRHSITKMSLFHFVAAAKYKKRVEQLGECPNRVYLVGGLGADAIKNVELKSKTQLERELSLSFGPKNLLITFHPVTLETKTCAFQMQQLLDALESLKDTHIILTMPNADTDGRGIIAKIKLFCENKPHAYMFDSLGQVNYYSCLAQVDGLVGNSSSGILEAPSFKIGTINIGDRQKGRVFAQSVIQCDPIKTDITSSIEKLYSSNFRKIVRNVKNPYGEGGASKKILRKLENMKLDTDLKKRFYDI